MELHPPGDRQGLREGQDRGGEDHRDHAARVDLKRQMGGLPAHHPAPHHTFGVLHRNAPLPALHQHDERHHPQHHRQDDKQVQRRPLVGHEDIGVDFLHGPRQPHHNAGEDDQRHAVADAPLRDLLAQPHDERRARGQRQDGHQDERKTRVQHEPALARLQSGSDPERLHDRKNHRQVPRPLRDLAPPQLAFLLELLQGGHHHGQQLQNDRRRDVGHDAQGEDGQPPEHAAAEQVDEPEQSALVLAEELVQLVRVDPRRGDVPAQTVDRQQPKREQHAPAQVRDAKHVRNGFEKLVHGRLIRRLLGAGAHNLHASPRGLDLLQGGFRKQVRLHPDGTR